MCRIFDVIFRITLLSLFVLCMGITLFYAYRGFSELERLRAYGDELSSQLELEHAQHDRIIFEMEAAMTDTQVERLARERLGLVMSNEIIFIHEND